LLDSLLLAALTLLFVLSLLLRLQPHAVPLEDAAMLLRYAQHLAQGFGVRWNTGDPPIDGATDFLFMAATAGLSRVAHIDVVAASRALNLTAQLFSIVLVFTGSRLLLHGNRWLSAAMAAYLIAGPALRMTNACFGTPCFAALLLACWCAGLGYARSPGWRAGLSMASLGLLAGLTRPEGVLIAAILLAATLYLTLDTRYESREAKGRVPQVSILRPASRTAAALPLLFSFLLIFAILGGAYFAWRWHYFGYPLPNPFYIKGNGRLYPASVKHAAFNLVKLLLPGLPLLPLGFLLPTTRRLAKAILFILLAFTLLWVLLNNWNNHLMRFQYAIVPLVLVTLPALVRGLSLTIAQPSLTPTKASRCALIAACILALGGSLLYIDRLFPFFLASDGMRTFALRLQPFAGRGYTMAVTEAGDLPFYSDWRTLDALGLNDATIAHHGGLLSTGQLDRRPPDLMLVHVDSGAGPEFLRELANAPPHPGDGWWNFEFLNHYAATHGYTLAAAWGAGPCNLHFYWLRPGIPDYDALLQQIRRPPYIFLDNGEVAYDFRNDIDTLKACVQP
jgi:hypothetical protein